MAFRGILRIIGVAGGMMIAAFILVSCARPVAQSAATELSFGHLGVKRLDVAAIDIVDNSKPTFKTPHVEHLMSVSPARAARQWAVDRLAATGTSQARAVYTIVQAAVIETALQRQKGLRGVLTTDQSERYEATLEIRLEIFDPTGRRAAVVESVAARNRTVPESVTLNDREKIWFEMTENLMHDVNLELEAGIDKYLTPYLR